MPKYASVIGDPIHHSRSPIIHGSWLKTLNIDGVYDAVHVKAEALEDFTKTIRNGERVGANVTMPHKIAVKALCDVLSPSAQAIGAVNTLSMKDGQLFGDNTDAYGFAANLDDQIPHWAKAKTALVLGAGGAARAVLFALQERGIERVILLNRTLATAEALQQEFHNITETGALDTYSQYLPISDLIINTTSLGLGEDKSEGEDAKNPWDFQGVKPTALAADIVYVPLLTPFLKAAQKHNLTTSDGLGMLLHQAVPGFERWFGARPDVTSGLRQTLLDDL